MKDEFNRIYWAIKNSDVVADGEYYIIHADHIHDLKMAIEHYLEDNNQLKPIDQNDLEWHYTYSYKPQKEIIENINHLRVKVNQIIRKINEEGRN